MPPLITLTEIHADWRQDLAVDPDQLLVSNVALTGRDSRNGYVYAESALRDAVALYDRKPVFLDHAADRTRPQERSTRDLVGSIVHPRFEDGRIRGDIRVLDTESGRTFLSLAQSDAPGVGMSHVVLAERSVDLSTVERIHQVISVDAVVNPATTTTFRESTDDSPHTPPPDSALLAERDELRIQLARLREQTAHDVRTQELDRLLAESTLPPFAVTPLFRQQLEQATSLESRRALIQDRRQLLQHARPLSVERRAASNQDASRAFVAAIRGKVGGG
jgi:hypothetical protein